MSDFTPGISEIYQIRDLMNTMASNDIGFFSWDTSVTYTVDDPDGRSYTDYSIVWDVNVQAYTVEVTEKGLYEDDM